MSAAVSASPLDTKSPIPTFTCTRTLDFKTGVYALACLTQSRFAAGGGAREGSKIAMWNLSGESLLPPQEDETMVRLISIDDNTSLVSAGIRGFSNKGGYFKVWEMKGPKPDRSYFQRLEHVVSAIVVHPNNRWITTGDWGGNIIVWDRNSLELVCKETVNEGHVDSLTFLKEGTQLASGHHQNIHLWDFATLKLLKTFSGHAQVVLTLAEMTDGSLVSGSEDSTIKVWDTSKPANQALLKTLSKVHNGAIWSLKQWSENMLVSGGWDGTFVVWDISTEEHWQSPTEHNAAIKALAICDRMIITGSFDKTVKVWEPK